VSQPPAADDDGETLDVRRVLETLDRRGVEYLLVGGMAARFHGATRTTKDVDVVPRSDAENLDRLAAALRDLGAFLRVGGLTEDEAAAMIVNGFIEPVTKELPMEYAVELNRLIQLEMEGSIG